MEYLETIPMPPLSAERIEDIITLYLLKHCQASLLKIQPISYNDVIACIWRTHKYKVKMVPLFEDTRKEAQVDFLGKTIQLTDIFFLKLENGDGRALFTLLHEISHVILHSDYVCKLMSKAARTRTQGQNQPIKTYQSSEWQAEHAAGVFLMPLVTLVPLIENIKDTGYINSVTEILAEKYGVSEAAANARFNAINKINLEKKVANIRANLYAKNMLTIHKR